MMFSSPLLIGQIKAMHREVLEADGTYALRETREAYTRNLTGEKKS
jgi:hypothetical protein